MSKLSPEQLKKHLTKELESNPKWRLFLDNSWLCPYCAEIAVGDLSRYPDPVPRVYRHLVSDCPKFSGGKERSLQRLREKLFFLKAEAKVKKGLSQPLWMYFDLQSRWLCPYCAQATKIPKDTPDAMTPQVIQHFRECFGYDKGKGMPKNESYLKKLVDHEKKVKHIEGVLKNKISQDSKWKVASSLGHWICPLCSSEQSHIDLTNPLNLTLNAPAQIANHLISSCPNFTPEALTAQEKPKPKTKITSIPIAPPKPVSSSPPPKNLNETTSHIPLFTAKEMMEKQLSAQGKGPSKAQQKKESPKPQKKERDPLGDFDPLGIRKAAKAPYSPMVPEGEDELGSTAQIKITSQSMEMLPLLPDVADLEFQFIYEIFTSSHIDFIDFITISEREVGVILVNIEKNLPMPLILDMKDFIQTVASGIHSPKEFLLHLNDTFIDSISLPLSLKVSYFILDAEKNTLRLARAGHNPLVLFNMARNRNFHVLKPKGVALSKESSKFREDGELRVKLQEGDLLVGYNKGILQCPNENKEPYGEDRFFKMVFQYGRHEAEYFRHKFLEKFNEYTGKQDRGNNLLTIAIKYKNPES